MKKLLEKLDPLLHARCGPMTDDLVLNPGEFGLGRVPGKVKPDATTTAVCGFCATGCGLKIHLKDGVAVNLSPDTRYPVNLGMACPKGWEALSPLTAPNRATTPLVRDERGSMVAVDWPAAMERFVEGFKGVQARHGARSVAYLSTGQIVNEEMAFLGALAKFGMGMLHGDSNTRQCMATAATAYKQSFGFDAPPYSYQDFEESDVLVFVGSNLCIAHPIMWQRVCRNPHRPEIIVVDPRKTETAMAATQHYAITPRSDLVLLYGLAHLLIEKGAVSQNYIDNHTDGYAAFAEFVRAFDPERVSRETGISQERLHCFANTIKEGKRVSFWWTMGVNQGHEATRTAQAIINLALMTGNMGRPGTGANSITGQCNAMGSRLYGNTTNLLGGHSFLKAADREKIASVLQIPVDSIPSEDSLAYDQIIEGIDEGTIRGLWIIATNGAHSWINQNRFTELAKKLEFLVVQDMYPDTESAKLAHLVLPAAGWGEKEGTFINSERRLGLVKRVRPAPGLALADFSIFRLIAHHWGLDEMFGRWTSPEALFQDMKKISRGQPCDITGIEDYAMIDLAGGIQWPCPDSAESPPEQERRLFADGKFFTPNQRARFVFDEPQPVPEAVDAEYPLLLLTGRGTSSQWHTQTRTANSDVLRKLYPAKAYIELNPLDAAALDVRDQDLVIVHSRRGEMQATAFLTLTVRPGQVFAPMHYRETNRLTFPAVDPHSRQPAYKSCAVAVKRAVRGK